MILVAKGLEALGIGCVLIGLVQGITSEDMWIELYLSLIGIFVFLIGWMVEKVVARSNSKVTEE